MTIHDTDLAKEALSPGHCCSVRTAPYRPEEESECIAVDNSLLTHPMTGISKKIYRQDRGILEAPDHCPTRTHSRRGGFGEALSTSTPYGPWIGRRHERPYRGFRRGINFLVDLLNQWRVSDTPTFRGCTVRQQ